MTELDAILAPRLDLGATGTPLHPLERLRAALGARPRLWIKRDDLSGRALGGNKLRKLELLLADARAAGATAVASVGGSTSNHLRLVAGAARAVGMRPYCYVHGDASPELGGNLALLPLLGAEVVALPKEKGAREVAELARADFEARARAAGETPFFMTYGAASLRGDLGYVPAVHEIVTQLGRGPKVIVAAVGTGGTITGLTVGAAIWAPEAEVVGWAVTPKGAQVFAGLPSVSAQVEKLATHLRERGLTVHPPRLRFEHGQLGAGYAKPTDASTEAIALLAQTEGLFVDPVYTAKALAGLIAELRQASAEHGGRLGHLTEADDVVFVHTGGAPGLFFRSGETRSATMERG